jgi:hypothetical protein
MTLRPGQHDDELISASLTGDLSESEQAALNRHLADCPRCRDTLAAFSDERRLISGMRHVPAPPDLGARVRAGIERGSKGSLPWWRRRALMIGAGASVATVAAAVMAVLVIGNLPRGPETGQLSNTPLPSSSALPSTGPSASADQTTEPIPTPTVNPQAFLHPGELGYFSMTGGSLEKPKLSFIKNETGESVEADAPSGPPIAAALSPDAEWIAYITEIGETGMNQVWALHLTNGETTRLGCSEAGPFSDRLLWSDDSGFVAFTLRVARAQLGDTYDCGLAEPGAAGTSDVWLFRTGSREVSQLTVSGDAFGADTDQSLQGATPVLVSHAAETPWTDVAWVPGPLGSSPDADERVRYDGVFLPLKAPIGELAVYWSGSMSRPPDGAWQFTTGGIPQVGTLSTSGPTEGTPLFADLATPGGAGFEDGHFGWGEDGDLIAFWAGRWNGTPQGDDYPSELAAYAGRVTSGGLTMASRLEIPADPDGARIISITFQPDGVRAVASVGQTSAGIGDPASADLYLVPINGGKAVSLGGASNPPPWDGPAVYGPKPNGFPS